MNNLSIILLAPDAYVWLVMTALILLSLGTYFIWRRKCRRWLQIASLIAMICLWILFFDAAFYRVNQLEVRHVEYSSKDLPAAFDGYRIVQFSDAHVGSLTGWRQDFMKTVVDSIKALDGDVIVFTGDLQNKRPNEIVMHNKLLSTIHARDGVFTVLGNHDYPEYIDADPLEKQQLFAQVCEIEENLGWTLLNNTHRFIHRGKDSIVIAGMQNDGEGRFPQLGNITNALYGLTRQTFVVMLEHDPSSWRRKILPRSHCQLTLSGHTHGGQFSFFGFSPAQLSHKELGGMYYIGDRAMNVSTGVGGVIPLRLGVTPEICVITLKKK